MSDAQSPRKVRCPQCRQEAEYSAVNPYRPFCSERCRLIDLGDWASENFRVSLSEESSNDENFEITSEKSTED